MILEIPLFINSTFIIDAFASIAFSTNSFTTLLGRSTTSPADIRLAISFDNILPSKVNTIIIGLSKAPPIFLIDILLSVVFVIDIFKGKIRDAKADVIALNAGAMLYLNNITKSLQDGVILASSVITSGKAYEKLISIPQTSCI